MSRFRYLKFSLVFILAYIGVKFLLSHYFPIPTHISLAVIAGFLSVGVVASLIHDDPVPLQSAGDLARAGETEPRR